jgi:phage gp29-like protein
MATLLDQWGRPIEHPAKPDERVLSAAAVRNFLGDDYPSSRLTPGKLAGIFREADQGQLLRQAELFEEMEEKDSHLLSCIGTRKNAVAGLPWNLRPASDDQAD